MVKLQDLLNINGFKGENLNLQLPIKGGKIDSRKIESGDLYFCLKGRFSDGHTFIEQSVSNGAIAAIVDNSYRNLNNYPVIYVDNVELAMGSIAKLYRRSLSAKIIAITGSNGKTTTKEMIYAILSDIYRTTKTEGNLNNFQGVPLTIFNIKEDDQYAIVEIGTNSFGEIKYLTDIVEPDYGIITNIGKAHLQNFIDEEGVLKEKIALMEGTLNCGGVFFLNCDDPYLSRYRGVNQQIVTYGVEDDSSIRFRPSESSRSLYYSLEIYDGDSYKLSSIGLTSLLNSRSAYAITSYLNLPKQSIKKGFLEYRSEGYRQNLITHGTTQYILDCYNANPTSMENSIKNISGLGRKILILGDMMELGEDELRFHQELSEVICSDEYIYIILIGERMGALYKKIGSDNSFWYKDIESCGLELTQFNFENSIVLIKGSRSIGLEDLYNKIVR